MSPVGTEKPPSAPVPQSLSETCIPQGQSLCLLQEPGVLGFTERCCSFYLVPRCTVPFRVSAVLRCKRPCRTCNGPGCLQKERTRQEQSCLRNV